MAALEAIRVTIESGKAAVNLNTHGSPASDAAISSYIADARGVDGLIAALDLVIVPIRYTDLSNGQTYDPPSADTISDFIKRTYARALAEEGFPGLIVLGLLLLATLYWAARTRSWGATPTASARPRC